MPTAFDPYRVEWLRDIFSGRGGHLPRLEAAVPSGVEGQAKRNKIPPPKKKSPILKKGVCHLEL